MLRRTVLLAWKSVGPHGFALRSGEDMNRGEDLVTIGFANIAVLDEQVL